MNKDRHIKVSQEHIDLGLPEDSSRCMIVEAVKEAVPGASKVHVDMQTIRWTDPKGIRRTYLTPATAQSALVRFDAGDEVKPFGFRLSILAHISKARKGSEKRQKVEHSNLGGGRTRARVGGRSVPMLGNATRRRFGIRNLRINQKGEVEQLGVAE